MKNWNRFLIVLVAIVCFSTLWLADPALAAEQVGSDGVVRQTLHQQTAAEPNYGAQELGTGSITLQVDTDGTPIDEWAVKVFQAGDDFMNQLWPQLQITPGSDVQTIVISGIHADLEGTYYVSMTSYDALYLATFTGAELGSNESKLVQQDESYITLDVSLPYDETTDIVVDNIDLHYLWPNNGLRTHVGQVREGAAIPAGNYSAQVWSWSDTWSYSLFQPPIDLSADNSTLTFVAEDVATVTATVDLDSVNATVQRVASYQFPDGGYLDTVTHVDWIQDGSTYSTDVSKGYYPTFGYVVYLTDSLSEEYVYTLWEPVTLDQALETELGLTEVQYEFACPTVSPGDMVYIGDLFANGSPSRSNQAGYWSVAKVVNYNYVDLTGTLNFYLSTDLISPVCSIRPDDDGYFHIPADLSTGQYHVSFIPDDFGPVPLLSAEGTIVVQPGTQSSTVISGTLSLPVAGTATVRLTAIDSGDSEVTVSTELSFNGSSGPLSFAIDTGVFTAYHLQYEVLSGGEGLVPWGYYDGSQFVSDQSQAAAVVPGQTLVLTLPQSMPEYYQILIHIQGEYNWSPSVWVQQAEQSGSSYRYVPVPDGPSDPLTIHSEPESGGMLLGIRGLSFEPESNRYMVGISMGNALFPVEVTSDDLGNEITLFVDLNYQPLAVNLPFTPDQADDLHIFLTGRDAYDVSWLQGAVKPGAQIPEGVYDVHLAVQTGGQSYSLRAKDYEHSATSSLDFPTSDLITLSVAVPAGMQVASAEQLAGSDQQTTMVPWAWDATEQKFALLINNSVGYQQSVVYLERNDWKYETVLLGVSLTDDLDLGAVALQARADLKNSFLPGEKVSINSFSVIDQLNRVWQVMRSVDGLWVPYDGELLLTSSAGGTTGCPFINGMATLPSTVGSYQLSYQLPGSELPVAASLPVDITIGGAAVYGQIFEPDGDPYENSSDHWVDMSLRNLDSGREWWSGLDGNGCYAFVDAISTGRYQVSAMPRGQYGGAVTEIEIVAGTPVSANLTLTAATITGFVLNPGSEETVFVIGEQCDPDAGVQLYRVEGGKEVWAGQANIARDGSYTLGGNLQFGTYRLHANAWGNSNIYAPAIPLTLQYAGTPIEQNIALTVPLVTGKVLDPAGKDFRRSNSSWADVCLRGPDGNDRWFGTDDLGRFLIGGDVAVGQYQLLAGARGDGNQYVDGAGVPVLLETGQTKVLNVSLAWPTLTGRVLTPGGDVFVPTDTATVELCLRSSLDGPDLAWTGVRSDGTFRFGAVASNGTYYLYAWDRGNDNLYARSLPETVTINVDQTDVHVQDIALTTPIVTGQVLLPDGEHPFTIALGENKGVHVTLRTADNNNTIVSETSLNWQPCDGSFRLGGDIQPGRQYRLHADTWGGDNLYANAVPLTVTVQDGQTLAQNIWLTNPQLQGQVLAPNGATISFGQNSWADICLRDTDGQDIAWAGVNQNGNFSIGGNVPTGDYFLFAFARGVACPYARSLPVTVHITAGLQTQNIRLTTPGATLYAISGRVLLPNNEIAGVGGITVVVKALPRGFTEQGPIMQEDQARDVTVVIPEGQNGVSYSIAAPLPPEGFDYIIQYIISAECAADYPQYRATAFYSDLFFGETAQYPIADGLGLSSTGDYPNMDLIVTKLRTISGSIALPEQITAPAGGLAVTIYCVTGEGGGQMSPEELALKALASVNCTILAGQREAQFELSSLPPNERFIGWYDQIGHLDVQGYRLMYQFEKPDGAQVYGFFNQNGSVGGFAAAEWLDVTDTNIANIAIDLVSFSPAANADIDGDGQVDLDDLALVAQGYGTDSDDPEFNSQLDLNQDGRIDLFDLVLVSRQMNLQASEA